MVEIKKIPIQISYGELPQRPGLRLQGDPRCWRLTMSVLDMTHRYLQRTPNERRVQMAASSSGRISGPHRRVTRRRSLCLSKAIQSQSRAHLGNAVAPVLHQPPATQALAYRLRSFSFLRPQIPPGAHFAFVHTTSSLFLRSMSVVTLPSSLWPNNIRPSTPLRKKISLASGISSSRGRPLRVA